MGNTKIELMQIDGDGNAPVTLGNDTVDSSDIEDGTIDSSDIKDGTIATADIKDANVTNAKMKKPCLRVYQEDIAVDSFTDNEDATGTLELDTTIPAGAVFVATTIHGITGFAGDTSAVITVGDGTDVDRYNTGTPDVFTTAAAGVAMGVPSGTTFHADAKTPTVIITGDSDFTSIVTDGNGAATLTLYYYEPV